MSTTHITSDVTDRQFVAAAGKLGVAPALTVDYATCKRGIADQLPAWAQEVECVDADQAVIMTGRFGAVELGASLLFGRYATLTSGEVQITEAFGAGDASPESLRSLSTDLDAAADAIAKAARVAGSPR